jgi:hypothetical protein
MRALEALGIFRRAPDPRPEADVAADVRAELEHHLACAADELVRAGKSPEEALAEARRRFGDLEATHRACLEIQTGERTMLQRIHLGVTILLFFAVVLMTWANLRSREAATIAAEAERAARAAAEDRLSAALAAQERAHKKPVDHIVIEVGDQLQVIDFEYDHFLNGTQIVAADGKILLRDAGWVHVAGLTREDAEKALTEACNPYYEDANVKVRVNP